MQDLGGRFNRSSLIALTLIVSACNAPQTVSPGVTKAERAREQAIQQEYASSEKLKKQEVAQARNIDQQARLNRVFAPIARAGAKVCASIMAGSGQGANCVFDARLNNGEEGAPSASEVNAYADGKHIFVNSAMMGFAADDNELAFVLAHELAHNILQHVAATQTNVQAGAIVGTLIDAFAGSRGYDTGGAFGEVGAKAGLMRYSAAFEAEADYVGMYILANAGGDYANAANFWRRMSVRNPDAIYLSSTHPSNSDRFIAMQKTAAEITAKKQRGQALLPEMKK